MEDARGNAPGQGRGKSSNSTDDNDRHKEKLNQIEYLLQQSTQGIHFVFGNQEIARVLQFDESVDFEADHDAQEVQKLVANFLDRPSLAEKQSFLERLSEDEYKVLLKAYFQLVEKTILSRSRLRH